MARKDKSDLIKSHNTKRCWSCNTHMQLHFDRCPSCKTKVGDVNEHGVAEKPIEWKNYILGTVSAAAFFYFIWRAFLN